MSPKNTVRQNVHGGIVTICHLCNFKFMSTVKPKKVQTPTLWKNLWRMWKTQGFQGQFLFRNPFWLWTTLPKTVTFGGIFPVLGELCCGWEPGSISINSFILLPFSILLPQKSRPHLKRREKFLLKFHKRPFV